MIWREMKELRWISRFCRFWRGGFHGEPGSSRAQGRHARRDRGKRLGFGGEAAADGWRSWQNVWFVFCLRESQNRSGSGFGERECSETTRLLNGHAGPKALSLEEKIRERAWDAKRKRPKRRNVYDAPFHFAKFIRAGILEETSPWRRRAPRRAERNCCRKRLVLAFDLGLSLRAASTAALARLRTTRRMTPSTRALFGVRTRLKSSCMVMSRQWCNRLSITQ